MLELIRNESEVVGIRLQGVDFLADLESEEVIVPKKFLTGFRLSDVPDGLVIKPVEAIEGNVIHVENDIAIGCFIRGHALARVEEMGRRKLWDGEVGFGKFMEAMRQAVSERHETMGDVDVSDFQDDGDYIFLWYEVVISEDMSVENAIRHVEKIVAKLGERRDQILSHRSDPLLEILDRGSFDSDLAHALEMAEARDRSVALVFVDIDHFKKVNDLYGHARGDAVLKAVAQIIRAVTKEKGEAYRYGGEEIVTLLFDSRSQEASDVAEVVRRSIEESTFSVGMKVTVSCGVASYPANARTVDELVAAADAALYQAKHAGRNLVRVANAPWRSVRVDNLWGSAAL